MVKDARALAQGLQSTAAIATGAKAAKSASQALHAERSNTQSGEVYQNESQAAFRSLAVAAADEAEEPHMPWPASPRRRWRSMASGSPAASLRGFAPRTTTRKCRARRSQPRRRGRRRRAVAKRQAVSAMRRERAAPEKTMATMQSRKTRKTQRLTASGKTCGQTRVAAGRDGRCA